MKFLFKKIINLFPRTWLIRLSIVVRPLLVWFYRGNNFTDPIDGKTYRKFLPYGYENQRENALSPGTLSLERHRLLWIYLQRKTNFFSQKLKVLHIAPEQSFYKHFKKQPNLEYITCDLESPLADVKADIQDLPFENNSFDVIFCNHVLEHVENDKKALSELYRVMKNGGWGIFQVPIRYQLAETFEDSTITDRQQRIEVFGQYDHVRVYGLDYYSLLEKAGFSVEKVNLSLELSEEEIKRFALEKNEILPVVRK